MNETRFRIRKAEEKDLPGIMEIYAGAREFMAEHGNPRQWGNTNWPPEDLIRKDISEGRSFVCEVPEPEGSAGTGARTAAVFFYDHGRDIEPCYRVIEGKGWSGGDTYGVVHRIASAGSERGAGTFCILWAFRQCGYLRMDTHGDNYVMQNLLTKIGFVPCGIIHVEEDDDPRIAYEKTGEEKL